MTPPHNEQRDSRSRFPDKDLKGILTGDYEGRVKKLAKALLEERELHRAELERVKNSANKRIDRLVNELDAVKPDREPEPELRAHADADHTCPIHGRRHFAKLGEWRMCWKCPKGHTVWRVVDGNQEFAKW